jgi:hypothetical protein
LSAILDLSSGYVAEFCFWNQVSLEDCKGGGLETDKYKLETDKYKYYNLFFFFIGGKSP